MNIKDLLRDLSMAPGVSGFEYSVSEVIKRALNGVVDSISEDALGNIIAVKDGGGPSIMVAAHLDEIGLMVKHVDDKGFIRFAKLGGVPDHVLLGQVVSIHTPKGRVRGVIGCKAIHVMKEDERSKLVTYDKMFIDIGAKNAQEVKELGITVGTPITIDKGLIELRNNMVSGKAFDDRAGCTALIEALRASKPRNKVYAVFTIQEEVGLRGATVSAYTVNPRLGLAVDVTIAGDHPEIPEQEAPIKVGAGPVIVAADGRRDSLGGGLIVNPKVRSWLISLAEKSGIPYQLEVLEGGTTDATAIQLSRGGVPCGVIAIPTRYTHSFNEVISLNDLENAAKLIRASLESELLV
ncbi:MAG: M42 family metallopeptidase [Candidatus Nezhaarchaeales archaeon]